MAYSNKVIDHYENPRNVGSLRQERSERRHRPGRRAGVRRRHEAADQGEPGRPASSRTPSSRPSAAARPSPARPSPPSGSRARRSTRRWRSRTRRSSKELSLPPVKIHCSVLAEDAIKAAIADYKKKQPATEAGNGRAGRQRRKHIDDCS